METNCFEPSDILISLVNIEYNIMKSISWFYIVSLLHKVIRVSRYIDALRRERPGFDFRKGQNSSILHGVQPGPGAHPVSYPMGTEGDFHGGKAAGASR
jgi:hypothetical protein